MLLAVDIGNSNIVIGIYQADAWLHIWRLETSGQKNTQAYTMDLGDLFLENSLHPRNIQKVVLSSVVPDLTLPWQTVLRDFLGQEPLTINAEVIAKLDLGLERPHEIGADLVANAVAGYARYQQPCIVVDFGTALTFTTIGAGRKVLGVAIAPGLKTAMYSLFQNTAQLPPEVPLKMPSSALGRTTPHALQAGVVMGYVGLVQHLIAQIQTELGEPCPIVATGGLSGVIPEFRALFTEIVPTLTLDGLREIAG
jgi:type III pantothenate kinase